MIPFNFLQNYRSVTVDIAKNETNDTEIRENLSTGLCNTVQVTTSNKEVWNDSGYGINWR
jgi:hypothetical protein